MPDEEPTREGELLVGKYRLERRLGQGGMGEVYRARNEFVGRDVAIKVLRPELCNHQEVVQRFMREARAANAVRHPNVVDVLDMGTDGHGVPFIVQELLHGKDLADRLDEAGQRLPLAEILSLMIPVVDALGAAHASGVVHRDLKPENVFLTRTASGVHPKVLDFGISKLVLPGEDRFTATGIAMGTPMYMSPEQVQGANTVDARSDVWALGVMLYQLASGMLPFQGPSPGAIFVNICTRDPVPLAQQVAGLPPDYLRIVERCLRREPERRYAHAAALLVDLQHLQAGEPIGATGAHAATIPALAAGSSDDVGLAAEARAFAGGTFVPGMATPGTPAPPPALEVERAVHATAPPVVVAGPPGRRAALILLGSIGLGVGLVLAFNAMRASASPAATPIARPVPVAIRRPTEVVAPTPVLVAPTPAVPDAGAVAAQPPVVVAEAAPPVAVAPSEGRGGGRHGHHHHGAVEGASAAGDPAHPTPEGHPHAAPGVGTTEYE